VALKLTGSQTFSTGFVHLTSLARRKAGVMPGLMQGRTRLRVGLVGEAAFRDDRRRRMSVYRVTDLIGTSSQSWEDAASAAVKTASQTIRDLRVAEVVAQDIQIAEDGVLTYRTKLRVSFKYETSG
jgi:flavin-binding protein dodecin